MAARKGDLAKEIATQTICNAFGDGVVCIQDKKIYVNLKDGPGGEVVQLAIAMTMPKTPIEGGGIAAAEVGSGDGASLSAQSTSTPAVPTRLSETDRAKIMALKEKLGIKSN